MRSPNAFIQVVILILSKLEIMPMPGKVEIMPMPNKVLGKYILDSLL